MFGWLSKDKPEDVGNGNRAGFDSKTAELKSLSGTLGESLDELQPVRGNFCHTLRAAIGILGEEGADAFEFDVCSPEYLESETASYPILSGEKLIITQRFDANHVEEFVRKRLHFATGKDWDEIAEKISKWARWEFEDYEPD